MADPVLERLTIELESRLDDVTTDNGHTYTRARVVRSRREGYSPEHLLIALEQGSATLLQELEGNPVRFDWQQPFLIHLFVKPTDDDTEPVDAIINRFRSDVEKAVAAPANWEGFGGLAYDAHWAAPTRFTDEGGYEGITLELDVTYRVSERDPFTVA